MHVSFYEELCEMELEMDMCLHVKNLLFLPYFNTN